MKKKIIISVFSVLIFTTVIAFAVGAIQSYNYDMDPANGVDIMEGFGAVLTLMVGGFVIFYELDLFYTVYYFFIKPKTATKSILNIVSNLTLFMIFFSDGIANFLYRHLNIFKEDWILPIALFFVYIISRMVCASIQGRQSVEEK